MNRSACNRLTSLLVCLGIAVLVAIITVVWIQVGQGAFRPKSQKHNYTITLEEKSEEIVAAPEKREPHRKSHKELLEKTHLENGGKFDVQFVKPLKISPLPLHDHDILYEQLHNNQVPNEVPQPHHSGHFRAKAAEVWDPFPEYEFVAFGKKIHLALAYNDKFVSPTLYITHMMENYTERFPHNTKISGCFYSGTVKGDPHSNVAVSLCNGMTGYIQTSDGSYFIEPAEAYHEGMEKSILHRIKKIPHVIEENNNVESSSVENCGTSGKNVESGEEKHSDETSHHTITKRSLLFDNINTNRKYEAWTSKENIGNKRSTRDIWNNFDDGDKQDNSNHEFYIKTMVVADRLMYEYHKNRDDLTEYILTIMSHVALLFKDASIGNPMMLTVVRIHILETFDFLGNTSEEVLRKFCRWQRQLNEPHNVALLLTRINICKNDSSSDCRTLGVAEVGSMCSPSSCAVVRDRGLSTSFVIAHEIGHTLGMMHDEEDNCADFEQSNTKKEKNIMSKIIETDTKPWHWSNCSKQKLFDFLEDPRSKCLLESTGENYITEKISDHFPGELFEVDRQCELSYGKGSKLCEHMYVRNPRCRALWCTGEDNSCKSQYVPWADGTSCGVDSWCHHGECVNQDRKLLMPIDGDWGPWQEWSECSRTCGGGIMISKRNCDSPPPAHGGTYCRGKGLRYESCNVEACPVNRDFRELQCAEFNGKMHLKIPNLPPNTVWIPKYGVGGNESYCKLYCRIPGTSTYYLLKDKVIDGTKCQLNSYDICVNGICRPGGCDNKLYSKNTLDNCGICGGDNSKCQEISGTFNVTGQYGYNFVIKIPKGSSNIEIMQKAYKNDKHDSNYLALRDGDTNEYILNGFKSVSTFNKEFIFGGLTVNYSGSDSIIETISTSRKHKITQDLVVEVLSVGKIRAPDITYKYTISKEKAPRYNWQLFAKQWSKCDSICGGHQYRNPICRDLITNKTVSEQYCAHLDMNGLSREQPCNTHCQLMWHLNSKGPCSAHCGKGVRQLYYRCYKINYRIQKLEIITAGPPSYDSVLDPRYCAHLPKEPQEESCDGPCDDTKWEYSEWSECSKTCGGGFQTRSAKCVDSHNQVVNNMHCPEHDKIIQQDCNTNDCPTWSYKDWTPCSVTCGKGFRIRPAFCHVGPLQYNPHHCNEKEMRKIREDCDAGPCPQWMAGTWSACSVSCGEGIKTRDVKCVTVESLQVEDDKCGPNLKPNKTVNCYEGSCFQPISVPYVSVNSELDDDNFNYIQPKISSYRWTSGKWSQCSKSCGEGVQRRMVVCQDEHGRQNEHGCDPADKPVHTTKCNKHPCPYWTLGDWSLCNSLCIRKRKVSCQNFSGQLVEDSQCDLTEKPPEKDNCTVEQCNKYKYNFIPKRRKNGIKHYKENPNRHLKWETGNWSACSNSCGRGSRTRPVYCKDIIQDARVVDLYCANIKRPNHIKNCEVNRCSHTWMEGPWSHCSKSCGEGQKYRNVTCHKVLSGGFKEPTPINNNYCNIHNKPTSMSSCNDRNCNDQYYWSADSWSSCTQPCGRKGKQFRKIFCRSRAGKKVKRKHCNQQQRPQRSRKCNQEKCLTSCKDVQQSSKKDGNKEYELFINGRTALIYCDKMDTREPEEYITLRNPNVAEFYHKRVKEMGLCPYQGRRNESCNCFEVDPDKAGRTIFYKVRLNITSLRIIEDDFTFVKQDRGTYIKYGMAGDCYTSHKNCPQGEFRIDLRNTTFRLSNNVRWINAGSHANSRITVQDQLAYGNCGGHCGKCIPDPHIGLKVEVTDSPTIPKY